MLHNRTFDIPFPWMLTLRTDGSPLGISRRHLNFGNLRPTELQKAAQELAQVGYKYPLARKQDVNRH